MIGLEPSAFDGKETADAGVSMPMLTLMCDVAAGRYATSVDGRLGWVYFNSLDAALAHLGSLVDCATSISVCNELGKVFMVADVIPVT